MTSSVSVVLKQYVPSGLPTAEHFDIVSKEFDVNAPLADGTILVKLLAISADPYLRTRIKGGSAGGIFSTFTTGSVMTGFVAGKILRSNNPAWVEGDLFGAVLPFTTVQVFNPAETLAWKLTGLVDETNISHGIGSLGMPGATVIAGFNVLQPKKGEVIYINAAAGAVGGLVGQIAKHIYGCVVIGSAGGPDKCKLLTDEFGFDFAIDYKTVSTKDELVAKIKAVSPDGLDMVFENVGGFQFDAALELLKTKGRIAICGAISSYNDEEFSPSQVNLWQLIYKQVKIEGFLSGPVLGNPALRDQFLKDMSGWIKDGKVHIKETTFHGINEWPTGFQSLFTGGNTGKVVVRLE